MLYILGKISDKDIKEIVKNTKPGDDSNHSQSSDNARRHLLLAFTTEELDLHWTTNAQGGQARQQSGEVGSQLNFENYKAIFGVESNQQPEFQADSLFGMLNKILWSKELFSGIGGSSLIKNLGPFAYLLQMTIASPPTSNVKMQRQIMH